MLSALPDVNGHFGQYGGSFVPETLMHPLEELKAAYAEARRRVVSAPVRNSAA